MVSESIKKELNCIDVHFNAHWGENGFKDYFSETIFTQKLLVNK